MSKKQKTAITPTRDQDYPIWYQQVIKAADLAENSAVRGCMVIKPWGYSIWENIKRVLDKRFKQTGHQNAYFPLFIPLSYLEKEAEHVEGFAKECAVVTHHRLSKGKDGKLVPDGKLEEPLVVRPTSEMIIGDTFSKWIESYRDLPLKINQWANVVRWEMRTRLFLRTAEILWQEGHTVHATKQEAIEETEMMLEIYKDFCKKYLAIPVITGKKTEAEKFPGADITYSIEAMMQDRKSLQAGTSHFLGQNFSKSCDIIFSDEKGDKVHGWMTSWAITTRLIGAMIMVHSDDDGLILPPKIASAHIVLLPFTNNKETKDQVLQFCQKLKEELAKKTYHDASLEVILDDRDLRGGEKNWSWIKKGIPLRVEIGPKEIENGQVTVARRDKGHKDTKKYSFSEFVDKATDILDDMQDNLLQRANKFQKEHTKVITNIEEFKEFFTPKNVEKPEIHGGFALCHFCLDPKVEQEIQNQYNVSIRCIPLKEKKTKGKCFFTGKECDTKVIFAKAY